MDFDPDKFPQGTAVMVDWPQYCNQSLKFEGTVEGYESWRNQGYVMVKFVRTTHQETLDRLKWYKYSTFLIKYADLDPREDFTWNSRRRVTIRKI